MSRKHLPYSPLWFVSAILVCFSGCATTRSDFNSANVDLAERVVLGRIIVQQNGTPITENCKIVFERGSDYALEKEGLVFRSLPTQDPKITAVLCRSTSWYHYNFPQPIPLRLSPDPKTASYIGDVVINWNFQGGFKISSLFGALGAIIDSGNDGTLQVFSSDQFKTTVSVFHAQHGKKAQYRYVKTIIAGDVPPVDSGRTPASSSNP